jgi:hypothetical protein
MAIGGRARIRRRSVSSRVPPVKNVSRVAPIWFLVVGLV